MAVTIDDLAAHLNLPGNAAPADPVDRAEMQRMLDAALERVRAECGTAAAGASTVPVTSTGSSSLLLPVVRVSGIAAVLDPDGNVVTPAHVDVLAGVIRVPVGRSGVWRVTVTFDDLPASLSLAALIIAKHLYETQRTTRPAVPRPGGPGASGPTGLGFAIPARAADLMAPFRIPGIA